MAQRGNGDCRETLNLDDEAYEGGTGLLISGKVQLQSKTSEPQSEVKMNSDDDEEMTVDNESIQKERVSRDKERKQFLLKAKKKIKRVLKVNTSEQPQHSVAVLGLGLRMAVTKQEVFDYFSPRPVEVRLYHDTMYCFLRFEEIDGAEQVCRKYNGNVYHDCWGQQVGSKLYIAYVKIEDVPEVPMEHVKAFFCPPPEGLTVLPEYINDEEERVIMRQEEMDPVQQEENALNPQGTKNTDVPITVLKHRTVKHYGYQFRYETNDVNVNEPMKEEIPSYLEKVVLRMVEGGVFKDKPDQLTVNQYAPGSGIPSHVDTHSCFDAPIVAISVGSPVVMEFRRANAKYSVVVPPRSLLVMDGSARYGWTHSIPARKFDVVPDEKVGGLTAIRRGKRLSLTFRTVRKSLICDCGFPEACDKQGGNRIEENAAKLEKQLVHDVYDEIAEHFHVTRSKPWPRVDSFVRSVETGCLLDIGCGNGKYLGINKKITEIGCDACCKLLDICREKGVDSVQCSGLTLPFQDDSFAAVICIAMLHHLATHERRVECVREILRVLEDGGQALIYVWAKHQSNSSWALKQTKKRIVPETETNHKVPAEYAFLPVHKNESEFPENDMLVPWTNVRVEGNPVYHRYYHVFDEQELLQLVNQAAKDNCNISVKIDYDQGNWTASITKNPTGLIPSAEFFCPVTEPLSADLHISDSCTV